MRKSLLLFLVIAILGFPQNNVASACIPFPTSEWVRLSQAVFTAKLRRIEYPAEPYKNTSNIAGIGPILRHVIGIFEVTNVLKGWKGTPPKWVRLYTNINWNWPHEIVQWPKNEEITIFANFEQAQLWNNKQKTGIPNEKVVLQPWMCGLPTLKEANEYFLTHNIDGSKKQ